MAHTEKEALAKWCPFTQKHCKATECMLFIKAGEEYREVRKVAHITSNIIEPSTIFPVFQCGVTTVPMITAGNISIPAEFKGDNE